ncbi:MAG TPA: MBL fold metallo-hydrolase [Chthoniobacteraceae bacterium]|nr:MBL fold metallo-hydrolase [Chthoniobacteraceae bacterium]
MIEPLLRNDAFLADVERPLGEGGLRLWWLGQSGFLVRLGNRRLLLDPYLSDSLTNKYATTEEPHVRMTARVIAPERLTQIDVVTSSHNHTDHLDADTLRPLLAGNPEMALVIPEANRAFVAQRLGIDPAEPIGLDDGASVTVAGFEFHGIAAAHNEIDRDASGKCHCLGYIIRCGPWTLYHSGDTLLYPDLAEKLRAFAPIDVALLPINGHKPERRVAGNLDGAEAAQLAHAIGARCVIPCHYEMFEFNTADPRELFVPECERLAQPYRVLRAGECWSAGA